MRRHIFFCAYLLVGLQLSPLSSDAQKMRQLEGVVLNAHNNALVDGAEVRCENLSKKTKANGTFNFNIIRGEPIYISHPHFQTRKINYRDLRGQTFIKVYISYNTTRIGNIVSASKTELVHGSEFENVQDFVFLGDTLVLMAFMESKPKIGVEDTRFLKNSLSFFKYGLLLERIILPDNSIALYKDIYGRLFVSGNKFCLIVKGKAGTHILEEIDAQYFDTQIKTATVAGRKNNFFGATISPIPELVHYVVFGDVNSAKPIRYVRNEEYFENIQGDYRALMPWQLEEAAELEDEHGIDKSMFAPLLRQDFSNKKYDFPYAPAYGDNGAIYIFDHLNGLIFHHDMNGTAIDSVAMYHHRFDGEKYGGMIQDEITRKCYAVHDKSGVAYIREVVPQTGAARQPIKLRNPFPRAIRIYDGWVYYAFKIPGGKEPYKLYREKLPY